MNIVRLYGTYAIKPNGSKGTQGVHMGWTIWGRLAQAQWAVVDKQKCDESVQGYNDH